LSSNARADEEVEKMQNRYVKISGFYRSKDINLCYATNTAPIVTENLVACQVRQEAWRKMLL